ncbi:MAG TPA: CaiB/BaiF CoA-transferase family protein [Syntrophomonadaceae bacterium]|nr:CaiB/BaiF CoA-transferase family protein [Syntrophomonadaceae bacterium]
MVFPLAGIKVLDLSMMMVGPFCTQVLADYGAEVIKIEPKNGERGRWFSPFIQGESAYFYSVNRNKKSLTLDLSHPEGKAIFLKLAAGSDVIVHAFRPGIMDKLELSYENIRNINTSIIYCALSGFGSSGPFQQTAAHDLNIVSLAGVAGLTGTRGSEPALSPIPIASTAGGSLNAVIAILLALINRQQTGQGQYCDISMMDGLLSLLGYTLADWSGSEKLPERGKSLFTGSFACYHIYETQDKKYISVGAIEPKFWQEFCDRIGMPQFVACHMTPDMQEQMIAGIQEVIEARSQKEWIESFSTADICVTPLLDLDEMTEHPQVKARDMIIKMDNFKNSGKTMVLTGLPIKFSESLGEVKLTFPEIGEHKEEILTAVGYTPEDIDSFKTRGII